MEWIFLHETRIATDDPRVGIVVGRRTEFLAYPHVSATVSS